VDAEETGVEAEAEDDLRQRAEEDQQGQVADILRGEEPDVEGQEKDGDDVGEDVGRAVDGGMGRELAEVREEPGGELGIDD
jgi:hypothetical protein